MKKLVLSVIAVVLTVIGLGGVAVVSPANAAIYCPDGEVLTEGSLADCTTHGANNASNQDNLTDTINTIINVVLGVVGFLAVAMIILGGISYVTSQGDASKTTKARNTILYGVIGLVVALLAFAIVNFVLANVFKAS